MIRRYKELKIQMGGVSDETAALVLVAEELSKLTKAVNEKVVLLDGVQLATLRDGMEKIATTVHGVGQMVENLHQ